MALVVRPQPCEPIGGKDPMARRTASRASDQTNVRTKQRPNLASAASAAQRRLQLGIGDGWSAELAARPGGALLRIANRSGGAPLEIEISLTEAGPVVRARAAALDLESDTDLVARCARFRVEARDSVDIVAGGSVRAKGRSVDVEATLGSARVRANDDVQLLGENVLLNCDRNPPVPAWASRAPRPPEPTLPVATRSGDLALADD